MWGGGGLGPDSVGFGGSMFRVEPDRLDKHDHRPSERAHLMACITACKRRCLENALRPKAQTSHRTPGRCQMSYAAVMPCLH